MSSATPDWISRVIRSVDGRDRSEPVPLRICRACVEALSISGASVLLKLEGGRVDSYSTDDVAARLVDAQLTLGEGPQLDAVNTGRLVLVDTIDEDSRSRWPVLASVLEEVGIGSVFAFPVGVGAVRLGVLQLHRDRPGSLSEDELRGALAFAEAVLLVLVQRESGDGFTMQDGWAIQATTSHAIVHQAEGMLTVQLGIGIDEAFVRLRGFAFATGSDLREVAQDIVERRLHLGGQESEG